MIYRVPLYARFRYSRTLVQTQRDDVQRRDQTRWPGRAAVRVPQTGYRDPAALRRRPGQPVAVRRRRESGADDQAERTHVAVHAGVQHGRQHQVLRVPGHCRAGGQQGDRGGRAQVRDPGPDRPVRHHPHAVRVRKVQPGTRARPEPPLAGEAGAGSQLHPGGGVQPGRVSLLHGSGHQEATGQDQHFPGDQRHRTAEEGRQLPKRDCVQVCRPGAEADRRGGAAQAQPEGAAVVARGRPRVGPADRVRRVLQELRRQPRGRRPVVAVDRAQPQGRHRNTERNHAQEVGIYIFEIQYNIHFYNSYCVVGRRCLTGRFAKRTIRKHFGFYTHILARLK